MDAYSLIDDIHLVIRIQRQNLVCEIYLEAPLVTQ